MEWSVRDREILDTVGPADRPVAARLLARIRAIEAACLAGPGSFDWELLDEDTQDEYDLLRSDLSKLRYPDEAPRSAEEVHQQSVARAA
jgi:hypothetical protein